MYYLCCAYLCTDLVPVRLYSGDYVEHWKAWLEAIMFIWMTARFPQVGNQCELKMKELNKNDRHAVVTKVSGDIFRHVPCEFSKIVHYFIKLVFQSNLRMLTSNNFQSFMWSTNRAVFKPLCIGLGLCKSLF